jgi:Holliday junction resolvase RusA-like endonuclease
MGPSSPNSVAFRFTVPGTPPSGNHLTDDINKRLPDGTFIRSRRKKPGVEAYQAGFTKIARTAKKTGFAPKNQIIVAYEMVLHGKSDVDNVMKACNDALALALEVNDDADYFKVVVIPR